DQIGMLGARLLQGLLAVERREHLVSLHSQTEIQDVDDVDLVVHDQDLALGHDHSPPCVADACSHESAVLSQPGVSSCTEAPSKASTTSGSNRVPASFRSSPIASSRESAERRPFAAVMRSNASTTARMRPPSGISVPSSPRG